MGSAVLSFFGEIKAIAVRLVWWVVVSSGKRKQTFQTVKI